MPQQTEMGQLLKQLSKQWGSEKLLTEKEFLIQRLIDAYQPSLKTACILVERAMDFGLGQKLYQIWLQGGGKTISKSNHDALIAHLVSKADFSQNKAALTVGYFDEMIGWKIQSSSSGRSNAALGWIFFGAILFLFAFVQSPEEYLPRATPVPTVTARPTATTTSTAVPTATIPTLYYTAPQETLWSMYPVSTRYEYHQLSYEEKLVFSAVYDAYAKGVNMEMRLPALKTQSINRIVHVLENDCPELLATKSMIFDINLNLIYNKIVISIETAQEIQENKKKIISLIPIFAQIRSDSSFGVTDYEHQAAVDRYIIQHCKYELDTGIDDKGYLATHRMAFAGFLTRKAVCEGYARSAQLALRYFGIPAIYVVGDTAKDSHAWNLVQIGGNWYQYDPTWNDSNDSARTIDYFPCFNLTDTQMLALRKYDSCYAELGFYLPSCYSTKANYYARQGRLLGSDWKSQLVSQLANERRKENKYIGFGFQSLQDCEAAVKALKGNRLNIKGRYSYYWVDEIPFLYFVLK